MVVDVTGEGLGATAEHRAGTGGQGAAVDLAHRHQFGTGAGEEAFLGGMEVIGGQRLLLYRDVLFARETQDQGSGDTGQGALAHRWSLQHAIAHDEQVVGSALGHSACAIEHHRLVGAGAIGLDACQDVVQVVQALDVRIQSIGWQASGSGDDQAHPVGAGGVIHHLQRGGNHDQSRLPAVARVDPQRSFPTGNDQAQVARVSIEGANYFRDGIGQFRVRPWAGQGNGTRRISQAVDVFGQKEGPSMIKADAFEHPVSVQEPVIIHRNAGFRQRHDLAVQPTDAFHADPPVVGQRT